MRIVLSTIALIIYLPLASQSLSGKSFLKSFELSIGTKAKVTPIYFEGPYDFIFLFIPNIQQQPDAHLSGFGSFFLEENFVFNSKFSLSLHQTIRKDFLVTHIPFDPNNELERSGDEKRFFYDLYAHLKYTIPSNKKASFNLGDAVYKEAVVVKNTKDKVLIMGMKPDSLANIMFDEAAGNWRYLNSVLNFDSAEALSNDNTLQ